MSVERALIEHCSPTLASLKVGSLFCFLSPACEDVQAEITSLNAQLRGKGLHLLPVKSIGGRTLCYLYRQSQLEAMLAVPEHAEFLRSQGYEHTDAQGTLDMLIARLRANPDFPHEIGLFLGYPLGDVIGFIENKGQNCLCCGCWKAYTDACAAQKLFAKFGKCTEVYRRKYTAGRTLSQLTVAA